MIEKRHYDNPIHTPSCFILKIAFSRSSGKVSRIWQLVKHQIVWGRIKVAADRVAPLDATLITALEPLNRLGYFILASDGGL